MKNKYKIISISILFACLLAISAASTSAVDADTTDMSADKGIVWDATITGSDGTFKGTDWVIICEANPEGVDGPNGPGTSGEDPFDILKSPAPPAPFLFMALNDGLTYPYHILSQDCRYYPDTYKVYNLTVTWDPAGPSITRTINLTWNQADFNPSEYNDVDLFDDVAGSPGTQLIDMKANSLYQFTMTSAGSYPYAVSQAFHIVCSNGQIPVEGENCFNPYIVDIDGDLDYSVSHTTVDMKDDYSDTDMGLYDGGDDTIYRLDVSTDTMVRVTMDPGTASWTGIGLFDDCPDVGNLLISDTGSLVKDKAKGVKTFDYTLLTADSPYYLMVDSWPSPQNYSYDLTIEKIHDVGVTAINSPTLPVYNDSMVPISVQVENFGNDESSVPVHVWIEDDLGTVAPDVLLDEDFEAWPPAIGPTWQITNNGGTCVWESTATTGETNPFGTGEAADANSDWCGWGSTMDTELITPSLDTSSYAGAITLEFDFNNHMILSDTCDFGYSTDGGLTWNTIILFDSSTYVGAYHWTVDCTGLMVSDLMFRWHYVAAGWYYDCQLDNVYMEANLAAKDIVYDETETISIDAGESLVVDTFSDWYVDHGDVNYTVHACTELPTDMDDTNNCSALGPFFVAGGIHDVGFISVDSPADQINDGIHDIIGTVENFGDFPETNVPCNAKVYKIEGAAPPPSDLPYMEDFETAAMAWSEWTVQEDPVNGDTWVRSEDYGYVDDGGATGYAAVFDDDGYGSSSDNPLEELISPEISCAGESGVMLDFNGDFEDMAGDGAFWVHITNDGGSTWNEVLYQTDDLDPGGYGTGFDLDPRLPLDISAIADDETIQIKFTYTDTDPEGGGGSGYAWGVMVDDVAVTSTPITGQGLTKDDPLGGKLEVLVYETNAMVDVDVGSTASVDFGSYYFEPGDYRIELSTNLSTDEYPDNDSADKTINCQKKCVQVVECDTGLSRGWFGGIALALAVAQPGDCLYVSCCADCNPYNENVVVGVEDITIAPHPWPDYCCDDETMPVLNGNVSGSEGMGFNITADGVCIKGFEIIDCTFGIFVYNAADVSILNNTIHDNGIGIGLKTPYVGSIAINHNHIYGNDVGVMNYPASLPIVSPSKSKDTILQTGFEGTWVSDPDGDPYMVPEDPTYGAWDIDGLCTSYQAGYPELTHYITQMADYGGYGLPYAGTYCAGAWWSDGNGGDYTQDEWLKTPVMNLDGCTNMELSFYGIWNWASTWDDHVYIKASTDGGSTWTIIADLLQDPAYEQGTGGPAGYGWCWNEYQVVLDVSAYASAQTQFAYHLLGDPTMAAINYIDEFLLTADCGPTYTLTVDIVGNGIVELDPAGGTYPENTVVTLEAFGDPGWAFDHWEGDLSGDSNPTAIVMDDDKFVTAVFEEGGAPPCPDCEGIPGIQFNWFGKCKPPWMPGCLSPGVAVENTCDIPLLAINNWWEAPDGPSGEDIVDPVTGTVADGLGNIIVGLVMFDPWLGINAEMIVNADGVDLEPSGYHNWIQTTTETNMFFDGSDSFGHKWPDTEIPLTYYWSFGDGVFSNEESTSHIFDEAGIYEVYLRVSASDTEVWPNTMFDWDRVTIQVSEPDAPLEANGGGGSLGIYETIIKEPVQFNGIATGGTPSYSYEWDFGDGSTGLGQKPTHTYMEEGTYTVTLTVRDSQGSIATDESTVEVAGIDELVANVGGPYQGSPGEAIYFTASANGGKSPYTYAWDFGDGTTAAEQATVHVYDEAGTYTVTVTITDSHGNSDEHTSTVTIVEDTTAAQINDVKAGLGLKATIVAGDVPVDWSITVDGNYIFIGGEASGQIPANAAETVKLPFTIGIGSADVTITAGSTTEQYEVFMLGPFALLQ